jgi:rsbT antagonist protein RsbS
MSDHNQSISIVNVRGMLMVTMPSDPDDSTVTSLQNRVLAALERHNSASVVLDISAVETLDSFFAQTVSETARMVAVMGGRTIVVGMRPAVAVTATQIGITLGNIETALTVDRALSMAIEGPPPTGGRGQPSQRRVTGGRR